MKKLFAAIVLASLIPAAHAIEYTTVQPAKSAVKFTYTQMGVAVDGKFSRFSSQLNFDPAKPTAAKARQLNAPDLTTETQRAQRKPLRREPLTTKKHEGHKEIL